MSRNAADGAPRSTKTWPRVWLRREQSLFRNRLRRRPALYPASRRTEGLHQDSRQEHDCLCRLQRQPAVHHARQSVGESQGLYLHHGLCPPPQGEALGRSAGHRRRPALLQSLMPKGYRARPEQAILFRIAAWDTNCPQHIPQKFDAADVAAALAARDEPHRGARGRVSRLEGPVRLRGPFGNSGRLATATSRQIRDNIVPSCGRHRR